MSPEVRQAAHISTARGCGFVALGIVTLMIGFVYQPSLSLRMGGTCFLIAALILVLKARRAPRRPFRDTEVWLLLDEQHRPNRAFAQTAIAHARAEAFYHFAHVAALLAVVLLGGAVVMGLFGH
ncbi:hypothetical protein [Phreatobacter sp.]|uniref:hypothetical protein n=1 Tax=Phreatobacter sp. TaxID=1966341 RepID=UPI0025D060A7|nr:hypothetical protein [Phreatobacter sp.]